MVRRAFQSSSAVNTLSILLPFSYPNVCKTRLSGQLFLIHSQLPWHEDLWISPLVSVSHRLHRRFYVIGRSHCPGRPTFRMKLAKLLGCKPPQIHGGIEIPVDDQATLLTLIGPMFQRHALFDMPTARTAFCGGEPAGGDSQVSPGGGPFWLWELQQLPHRRIGDRSCELAVGHHAQDVEVFAPDDPALPRQFGAELV